MSVTFFEQWYAGSLKIRGYEPVSASGLPVYVYFSGTGTSNTRTAELEFPRQMALRDYIGAWVEYPNHASYARANSNGSADAPSRLVWLCAVCQV